MVSVGERPSTARTRAFVGRETELGRFGEALAAEPEAPFAFYVHGPGGMGKSTLLRRLADRARAAGRLLVELDGRFASRDPADFERAASPFPDVPGFAVWRDAETWAERVEGTLGCSPSTGAKCPSRHGCTGSYRPPTYRLGPGRRASRRPCSTRAYAKPCNTGATGRVRRLRPDAHPPGGRSHPSRSCATCCARPWTTSPAIRAASAPARP
ncbi:AAA family ATPase [Streptomyces sp. 5112.2]|uniref:AAA family ATPase n=2 Tax=unclassified Streptomyces TaxID=2593676 RepID=UPI000AF399DC